MDGSLVGVIRWVVVLGGRWVVVIRWTSVAEGRELKRGTTRKMGGRFLKVFLAAVGGGFWVWFASGAGVII